MIKTFFTTLFSIATLCLISQDTQTLNITVSADTELQISDSKTIKTTSADEEQVIGYSLLLKATVLDNSDKMVKLQISPVDFSMTCTGEGENLAYNSANDPDYSKNLLILRKASAIVEYSISQKSSEGPKLAKGGEDFLGYLTNMINADHKEEAELLLGDNFIIDFCQKLVPIKDQTEITSDGDYGYAQMKDKSNLDHITTSKLTLVSKEIGRSYVMLSKVLTESEKISDISSGHETTIETSGSGDIKLSLKTGLLMSSYERTDSSITTKSSKNESLEEITKVVERTIVVE